MHCGSHVPGAHPSASQNLKAGQGLCDFQLECLNSRSWPSLCLITSVSNSEAGVEANDHFKMGKHLCKPLMQGVCWALCQTVPISAGFLPISPHIQGTGSCTEGTMVTGLMQMAHDAPFPGNSYQDQERHLQLRGCLPPTPALPTALESEVGLQQRPDLPLC